MQHHLGRCQPCDSESVTADENDRIRDLPDDGSRQKEVFARFGLAVYKAALHS